MPGGDRTGPNSQGPKTGRGAGYCGTNEEPGYTTTGFARGGRGFGWRNAGRGMRNRFRAPFGRGRSWFGSGQSITQEQEKDMLRSQARNMQD